MGTKNNPGETEIRWGSTSKPAFGGISFYIVFLLSFAVYAIIFASKQIPLEFFGVLIACSIGFLVGLADDAYNTKPILKFLGQFASAFALIVTNNYITIFDNNWFNYGLTFLWVIGMMNSINMLDNMDGVTTSVSIGVISTALFTLVLTNNLNHIYFWILLGTLAALSGFLYYNWNPSRMYMGDTGSQFLGALLAALGIYFFWNGYKFEDSSFLPKAITPILAFLPSIIDTTTVTINRIAKGNSPFVGGRDHTTHHLSYLGLKDRHIAIFFLSLTFICGGISLFFNYQVKEWSNSAIIGIITLILIAFGFLFGITKRKYSNAK
jgi:UDP-GlcNAc:undecaprenyl-phosphate GlcNAc-1-phosphate transferase